MTENLPQIICDSLKLQISNYKEIYEVQNELLKKLDVSNELNSVLELLNKKSLILDKIHEENISNAPLIKEFVERKEELKQHELYSNIESLTSEIEKYVSELRTQDDIIIKRFDPESQSKNRIDAFRGLR